MTNNVVVEEEKWVKMEKERKLNAKTILFLVIFHIKFYKHNCNIIDLHKYYIH